MRLLFVGLLLLTSLIQYPLWMGWGGWFDVWDLQMKVSDQRTVNDAEFLMLKDGRISFDGSAAALRASTDPYLMRFLS